MRRSPVQVRLSALEKSGYISKRYIRFLYIAHKLCLSLGYFTSGWNDGCSRVHGLCAADTANAPIFPEVWKQIAPKIEGLPLVAHNKAFDESCLKAVFRVYQMDYPDYEFHCTCIASRKRWPGGRHNLDVIAARCGYDLTNHHHALADAEACAVIALQIL